MMWRNCLKSKPNAVIDLFHRELLAQVEAFLAFIHHHEVRKISGDPLVSRKEPENHTLAGSNKTLREICEGVS